MIIYCDRLSKGSCRRILRLRQRGDPKDQWSVRLLDDVPATAGTDRYRRTLQRAGVTVESVNFDASRLRTADGECVPFAAAAAANHLALRAANLLIRGSPTLANVDAHWKRNTVRLYLAKSLWVDLLHLCLRLKVTDTLASRDQIGAHLVLHLPQAIDVRWLNDEFGHIDLHWCKERDSKRKATKGLAGATIQVAGKILHRFVQRLKAKDLRATAVRALKSSHLKSAAKPGVLVLQQDDLGTDRSYRTQPHWMLPEMSTPAFQTFVLPKFYVRRSTHSVADLEAKGIVLLSDLWKYALRPISSGRRVFAAVRQDMLSCALRALLSRSPAESAALTRTAGLLLRSWVLGRVCCRLNIKVFLSAEGFLVESNALCVVAPSLGISTVAYQYSNLSRNNVVMMTTADTMVTFSDVYESIWTHDGIGPVRTIANGYVFDSSFDLLRTRARDQRARLEAAGATFVICFFDETIQHDKYGIIRADEHNAQLLHLLRMLVEDSTLGVVVKTQYCRNKPSELLADHPELQVAMQTGRYIELEHGTHRNTTFAAEAAMMADLSIGNAIGATASLEAALTGGRSIMVNSHGLTGVHDEMYARANIVFSSFADALAAAQRYRAKDGSQEDLGDWTPILTQLDPFRDGNAGRRLRSLLDELTKEAGTTSTEPSESDKSAVDVVEGGVAAADRGALGRIAR